MSEWLKEHAWKACVGETLPRVRIPLSPPIIAQQKHVWRNGRRRGSHPHASVNRLLACIVFIRQARGVLQAQSYGPRKSRAAFTGAPEAAGGPRHSRASASVLM